MNWWAHLWVGFYFKRSTCGDRCLGFGLCGSENPMCRLLWAGGLSLGVFAFLWFFFFVFFCWSHHKMRGIVEPSWCSRCSFVWGLILTILTGASPSWRGRFVVNVFFCPGLSGPCLWGPVWLILFLLICMLTFLLLQSPFHRNSVKWGFIEKYSKVVP